MRRKRVFTFLLTVILIISMFVPVYAKSYYSYKQLGLDYKLAYDNFMYGEGKNGFKFVSITNVKGNTIYYRYTHFKYDSSVEHDTFLEYGKTYTAKLTSSTKYYKQNWQRVRKLNPNNKYKYGSKKFKSLKFMEKVSKSKYFEWGPFCNSNYVKIKNGKAKKLIDPHIYAI